MTDHSQLSPWWPALPAVSPGREPSAGDAVRDGGGIRRGAGAPGRARCGTDLRPVRLRHVRR